MRIAVAREWNLPTLVLHVANAEECVDELRIYTMARGQALRRWYAGQPERVAFCDNVIDALLEALFVFRQVELLASWWEQSWPGLPAPSWATAAQAYRAQVAA